METNDPFYEMLISLGDQIKAAMDCQMIDCSEKEKLDFQKEYPDTDFVVGDFAIRCITPEKYGLSPRQPRTASPPQ